MKNPLIFEVRTILMRECKLAHLQGGFFLCQRTWALPEERQPVLIERLRNVFPRASDVVRSNIGQVASWAAFTNYIHNVTHTASDAPTIGAPSTAKPATSAHGLISPISSTRISPCS